MTHWVRELKVATRGYLVSDWPLLQQSQEIWRVLPLPRMGCAESGVWHSRFRMILGVNCVWMRLKIPPPSAPGATEK